MTPKPGNASAQAQNDEMAPSGMSAVALDIERVGEVDFSKPLHRALLRDARLSWGARGLFAFLWDLPAGWRPNVNHLVTMGTLGVRAVTSLRDELTRVGALEIVTVRHNAASAANATATAAMREDNRAYRVGHLVGTRWRLYSPGLWAIEAPLGNPNNDGLATELHKTRNSVNASLGKKHTKVHPPKGSPSLRHHQRSKPKDPKGSTRVPVEWMNALALEVEIEGKLRPIKNLPGLRGAILSRYRRDGGPAPDVLAELTSRVNAHQRITEHMSVRKADDRRALDVARADANPFPTHSTLIQKIARIRNLHKPENAAHCIETTNKVFSATPAEHEAIAKVAT